MCTKGTTIGPVVDGRVRSVYDRSVYDSRVQEEQQLDQ